MEKKLRLLLLMIVVLAPLTLLILIHIAWSSGLPHPGPHVESDPKSPPHFTWRATFQSMNSENPVMVSDPSPIGEAIDL